MATSSVLYSLVYQFGDNFAYLVLAALGLAVIFGMMGVINLAHGEFIMCGAYVTIIAAKHGAPLPLAMLLGAIAAALAGVIVERLVIRHLYDRLFDSVVATWAISLIVQQTMPLLVAPGRPSKESVRRSGRSRSASIRSRLIARVLPAHRAGDSLRALPAVLQNQLRRLRTRHDPEREHRAMPRACARTGSIR